MAVSRKCLRELEGIIRSEDRRKQLNVQKMGNWVTKRRVEWHNHILGMATNRIVRITCDRILNGKKSPGRPKKDGRTLIEWSNRRTPYYKEKDDDLLEWNIIFANKSWSDTFSWRADDRSEMIRKKKKKKMILGAKGGGWRLKKVEITVYHKNMRKKYKLPSTNS